MLKDLLKLQLIQFLERLTRKGVMFIFTNLMGFFFNV